MNFHNIIKVYKKDWKRIVRNPVAIIILAGICVLPSLYAWVNIQACWDVYKKTDSIPVAIVNNDEDAYFKDKKINVGAQVVSLLKENHKIKWIFTNSKDANLGLVDSTYYAMIEIPSDFSSRFLTVLTDKPQKPQIIFKVDTKANPVASKITSTASNTLIEQISTEFISTVNETAFSELNTIGSNASKNKENILKLKDFVININRNMDFITNSLETVESNSNNINNFLGAISATMPNIQNGLESVGESNSDKQQIIKSMQESINNSTRNVDMNLNYLQISNTKVKNLFDSLNDSVSNVNSSKINTVLPAISVQLNSMNSSIDATIDYLKQCNAYDHSSDVDTVITSLTSLKTNLTKVRKSLVDFQAQLKNLSGNVDKLYEFLEKEIPVLQQNLEELDKAITSAITQLEDLNKVLKSQYITDAIKALKAIQESDLKNKLLLILDGIKNSKPAVEAALKSLDETITGLVQQIDSATVKIDETIKFLEKSKSTNEVKKKQVSNMIGYLQDTKPYISDQQDELSAIRSQLNSINSISKESAGIVNNSALQIQSHLNDAIRVYNSSVKDDIKDITNNLMVATKDSAAMIKNAQDLSVQISNMVKTAEKGTGLASELSSNLNKKLVEFKDVISSLGIKFEHISNNDISNIIGILQNDPKVMGDYVSNPFEIKEESINKIPNYGSGMAPIYTTLALWVGCLVMSSVLTTKTAHFDGIEKLTIQEKHFGKMMLFSTIAVIQGIIIAIGDIILLKIYVVNPALFIFFTVFSALVFSIITFTLVSTLGNIGKAISIIYLILQVAGSGGSYPIQVDPMIFRILQPLFPFTYTLGGLREAIAGPLASSVMVNTVALIIFAVIFLVVGYFTVKPLNRTIHRFEHNFKKSGLGE